MTPSADRFVIPGILAVWGVTLSYFCFSGRIDSYLHPSFHLGTALSGIVLVLLAIGMFFFGGDGCDCAADGTLLATPNGLHRFLPDEPLIDHTHRHGGLTPGRLAGWIVLVVPLLVASAMSPSYFGATTVMNRGFVEAIDDLPGFTPYVEPPLPTLDGSIGEGDAVDLGSYLTRNDQGQIIAQTVDLLYAAAEPTMQKDFENKEIELVGQFMPARANNAAGDRFNLVRMFIMCCAADARPVAVTIQAAKPDDLPEMSWIKVTGKATFPVEGGRRIPVVVADSVTPTDPPAESFIY
jgi:uncharacterized repeat protein (TIGR03943 family)